MPEVWGLDICEGDVEQIEVKYERHEWPVKALCNLLDPLANDYKIYIIIFFDSHAG